MGMKARTTTAFEESARILIANALTVAMMNGDRIVQGACGHCDSQKKGKTSCVLCAVLMFRRADMVKARKAGVEASVAKIFNLPEKWVIDMVTGFDDDGSDVTYRSAKRIGRQAWRSLRQ